MHRGWRWVVEQVKKKLSRKKSVEERANGTASGSTGAAATAALAVITPTTVGL